MRRHQNSHKHWPSLSSKSSHKISTFPLKLPLVSNTTENPRETAKRNIKNPRTRTQTSFELAKFLIWWSPRLTAGSLWTLTSHCMTTSSPAAATHTRARESPATHPKVFLCQMPSFLLQPSLFPGLHGSEYVDLHTLRLGCSESSLVIQKWTTGQYHTCKRPTPTVLNTSNLETYEERSLNPEN